MHRKDHPFITYRTDARKQKILALLGNSYDDKYPKPVLGKQKWLLELKLQLETDYDIGIGLTTDCEKPETTYEDCDDVAWSKRTLEQKTYIADRLRWSEDKFPERIRHWILGLGEEVKVELQSIELVLTLSTQPYFQVVAVVGPTDQLPKHMQQELKESFEHWYRAGNLNFSFYDVKWSKHHGTTLESLFACVVDMTKEACRLPK